MIPSSGRLLQSSSFSNVIFSGPPHFGSKETCHGPGRLYSQPYVMRDRELARCKRLGARLSVLVCDLDGFKQVNDRFGHLEGNKVLKLVAAGKSPEAALAEIGQRVEPDVVRLSDTHCKKRPGGLLKPYCRKAG